LRELFIRICRRGEMDFVERQNMKRPGSRRQMRFSFAD
jgi:hypothetical protein